MKAPQGMVPDYDPTFQLSDDEKECIICGDTTSVVMADCFNTGKATNHGCYECLAQYLEAQLREGKDVINCTCRGSHTAPSGRTTTVTATLSLTSIEALITFLALDSLTVTRSWFGRATPYEEWNRKRAEKYAPPEEKSEDPEEYRLDTALLSTCTCPMPRCRGQMEYFQGCNKMTCGENSDDAKFHVGCGAAYCYVCQEVWDEAHRPDYFHCPNADQHAARRDWVWRLRHPEDEASSSEESAPNFDPYPSEQSWVAHLKVGRATMGYYCYVCQTQWDEAHRQSANHCPNADALEHSVRRDQVNALRDFPGADDGLITTEEPNWMTVIPETATADGERIPLRTILYGFFNLQWDLDGHGDDSGLTVQIEAAERRMERRTSRLLRKEPTWSLPDASKEEIAPEYPYPYFSGNGVRHDPEAGWPRYADLPQELKSLNEEVQRRRREHHHLQSVCSTIAFRLYIEHDESDSDESNEG